MRTQTRIPSLQPSLKNVVSDSKDVTRGPRDPTTYKHSGYHYLASWPATGPVAAGTRSSVVSIALQGAAVDVGMVRYQSDETAIRLRLQCPDTILTMTMTSSRVLEACDG